MPQRREEMRLRPVSIAVIYLHQRQADVDNVHAGWVRDQASGRGSSQWCISRSIYRQQCVSKPAKWFVTAVDTGQPMIITLVVATGVLSAVDTTIDVRVKVSMNRVTQGPMDMFNVNRVYIRGDMCIERRQ